MVGVIVPDASNPFAASVIAALDNDLEKHGYHFLLTQARSGEDARRLLEVLEKYGVRNVLLVADLLDDDFLRSYVARLHGHVVGLGRAPSTAGLITICVDNKAGIDLAINHLVHLGHRRIAFVGGSVGWDMRQRRKAYEYWVTEDVLDFCPGYIQPAGYGHVDVAAGKEAMEHLLSLAAPPSAVIFGNDPMAIGAIKTAQETGLSVPEDISIIGFDDIPWAQYCSPALTTVRQPVGGMVAQAASLLKDMLEGREINREDTPLVFSPELIVRGSCGGVETSATASTEPGLQT